jgi:hypothetical protein
VEENYALCVQNDTEYFFKNLGAVTQHMNIELSHIEGVGRECGGGGISREDRKREIVKPTIL